MSNNREKTVTEIWNEYNYQFVKGAINLVVAPVGSGKTYFIFNELIKDMDINKIVYLCDTSNLEEATIRDKDYRHLVKTYNRYDDYRLGGNLAFGKALENSKVASTVMTYAAFGKLLKHDFDSFNKIETIICDEAHNLVKYMQKFDDENREYEGVLKYLISERNSKNIIMLTATHDKLIAHYRLKNSYMNTIRVDLHEEIKRLKDANINTFSNLRDIYFYIKNYKGFKQNKKAIIYTEKIETINKIMDVCCKEGINAIGIWSKHAAYGMDADALETREKIINEGMLPDDVDLLLINASYETGINIYDTRVELVIVHNSDPATQIQARGRVRKDIETLLIKENEDNQTRGIRNFRILLDDKWLDKPLTKDHKRQLVLELNLYQNGRLLKWTSIKKKLEESGYQIIKYNPTIKGKRVSCHIIKRLM